jgi:hypothetical protein
VKGGVEGGILRQIGRQRRKARMPVRFAGLCKGAKAAQASICASTSGVTRQVAVKSAPPCTTRCAAAVSRAGRTPICASPCASALA